MNDEETIDAILSIDRLPPYQDAQRVISGMDHGQKFDLFFLREVFEVFTVEYVDALAQAIVELQDRYASSAAVVEVCAGNGKLSRHLRERGIDIVAADDYLLEGMLGRMMGTGISRDPSVERLTHYQAMEKYSPKIVISSWTPRDSDVDRDVLASPSTRALISIGESPQEACGSLKVYEVPAQVTLMEPVSDYAIGRMGNSRVTLYEKSAQ